MSISSDLLQQIDDLLTISVEDLPSDMSTPYLQKGTICEDYGGFDGYEEGNTLINSYNPSDISDVSSINSNETRVTSIRSSLREKTLTGLSAKSDNSTIHRKLIDKHENLNNILDCMSDMIQQETRFIEEKLLVFVADMTRSVPYNSFNIKLTK